MQLTTLEKIDQLKQKIEENRGTPSEKVFRDVLNKLTESLKTDECAPTHKVNAQHNFKAVGWIKADLITVEGDTGKAKRQLLFKNKTYDCFCLTKNKGGFVSNLTIFDKYATNKGTMIFGVYPRWTHFPQKDKNYVLSFNIFSWNQNLDESPYKLNHFYVNGFWQFIPVYSKPVISVYRQQKRYEEDILKTNHCPTYWLNPPFKPFRFNPRLKDTESRKFVVTECRFNSRYDSLEVVKYQLIDKDSYPKYLRK